MTRFGLLPLLFLFAVCAAGDRAFAGPAEELKLNFALTNRAEMESLGDVRDVLIEDRGSAFPDRSVLELQLFRAFPTLEPPEEQAAVDAQSSVLIAQWRIKDVSPGFSESLPLPDAGSRPLSPGAYRLRLTFFRAQKQPLRDLLESLETKPAAEMVLFLGTKSDILNAVLEDEVRLRGFQDSLADYSARFQKHFQAFAAGPIENKYWNNLIRQDYTELERKLSDLEGGVKYAPMADAYSALLAAYGYFFHYQLGIIAYDLNGPESGEPGAKEKLKDTARYCGYLKPDLPQLIVEGALMRQTPMNLLFVLQGNLPSLRAHYERTLVEGQPLDAARQDFNTDMETLLQHAAELHSRFEERYSPDRVRTLVGRLTTVDVPAFADRRIIERHRKDAELFALEMRQEKDSFLDKLTEYMNEYAGLIADCRAASEASKSWKSVAAEVDKRLAKLDGLSAAMHASLKARSPEPTPVESAEVRPLKGAQDADESGDLEDGPDDAPGGE